MISVKKFTTGLIIILLAAASIPSKAQNVGLAFSFFFPKDGEFSTPISPFSFRGVGVSLNEFVGVETGFSLYRMTGMAVKDLPFETNKSIVGPNFTLLVPLELVLTAALPQVEMSIKGGGFGFYAFDNKINNGNMDAALVGWDELNASVVDSNFDGKSAVGFGYHFGGEILLNVFQGFGLSLEANYFVGGADFPLTGTMDYYNQTTNTLVEDEPASFDNSQIDMTGLEISIGIIMQTGGGQQRQRKRRR
ncbi:MAG: hypothetical protein ACNS60_09260 [Candidatus Cyclobacteriaceae bacterium M2_1C_046]